MKYAFALLALLAFAAPAVAGKNDAGKAAAADANLADRQQSYADAVAAGDSGKTLNQLQRQVDVAQDKANKAHAKCGC